MNNKSSGFTLVEALVVAIIVAIIAAVTIPIYNGFVTSEKQEVVKNLSQTAAVAANTYLRRTGSLPATAADLNLFLPDPEHYVVTINSSDTTVTISDAADAAITHSTHFD